MPRSSCVIAGLLAAAVMAWMASGRLSDRSLELAEKGYTPRQRVDQLRPELAAAEAALARIREEIADTTVEAPFSGVVNNIAVEPGQFVTIGAELATLLDNEPSPCRSHNRTSPECAWPTRASRHQLALEPFPLDLGQHL